MIAFFRRQENIPLFMAGSLVMAVLLTVLAPEEQTLGSSVRLVFIHAGLMWISFLMYTFAAVLSVIHLFSNRFAYLIWAKSSLWTALIILISTAILGIITAEVTWGGVLWQEPRMAMLAKMLLASVFVAIVSSVVSQPRIISLLNIALAALIWWLLLSTEKIIHPNNPIFTSRDAAIKIYPLAITLFLGIMALQIARYLRALSNPKSP